MVASVVNEIELLTLDQVSEILGIKPATVRLWIKQGRLPSVRFGKQITRVRRRDLERCLDAHTVAAVA